MVWNISAECIAGIIVLIIYIYSHKTLHLITIKNRIFIGCLMVTLGSIAFNILSTICLYYVETVPIYLTWAATILYFIFTPLMGLAYLSYTISLVYEFEDTAKIILLYILGSIPYVIYFILLLTSPVTGVIFDIQQSSGYLKGSWIGSTYLLFYIYCFLSIVIVIVKRTSLDNTTKKVLCSFPLIAVFVILIQENFPKQILTGSASCCALLIIYLYFQNKEKFIDPLTGLFNRQEFVNTIQLKLKHESEKAFSIIIISMNDFKFINDKFGYKVGDLFLKEVSNFLKSLATLEHVFRYDGDRFVIRVNHEDRNVSESEILQKLVERFKSNWNARDYQYLLSATIGVISYPLVVKDMDMIINGIDYTSKQGNKDVERGYNFFTIERKEELHRKNEIAQIMKESIRNDGFEIFIQPIYSPKEQKFTMGETLLRLNNTRIGPIRPFEFIPIAEEKGLIVEITYWVLDRVCKTVRQWLDEGKKFQCLTVNFSSMHFNQDDIERKIIAIIEKNNIPFSTIKIEITETALITNTEKMFALIERLNQKGIQFCLDDFGTGYSNLSSVLKLPFNTIKMDRSLVVDSVTNQKSALLMQHFAYALQEMGVHALAEGVENQEHDAFVKSCNFDYIQGFLYAKPMPIDEAITYFETALIKEV